MIENRRSFLLGTLALGGFATRGRAQERSNPPSEAELTRWYCQVGAPSADPAAI